MDPLRIAALLDPFLRTPGLNSVDSLSSLQLDHISTYIDLLLRWNARVNLTAVRSPEEIVPRHFGESLFAARHLLPSGADTPVRKTLRPAENVTTASPVPQVRVRSVDANLGSSPNDNGEETDPAHQRPTQGDHIASRADYLVDIGSGAGFPGLPMKIWSPRTRVTLIESNHKKVAFLREVIRALTLTDIDVFPARAETFLPASATLVTLRAVERFTQTLPTALTLLAPSARLGLLISHSQLPQAQALIPSLHWSQPISIPLSHNRILTIGISSINSTGRNAKSHRSGK